MRRFKYTQNVPIYKTLNGWFWHDETYDEYGPYPTFIKAQEEVKRYIEWLNQEVIG